MPNGSDTGKSSSQNILQVCIIETFYLLRKRYIQTMNCQQRLLFCLYSSATACMACNHSTANWKITQLTCFRKLSDLLSLSLAQNVQYLLNVYQLCIACNRDKWGMVVRVCCKTKPVKPFDWYLETNWSSRVRFSCNEMNQMNWKESSMHE